MDWIAMPFSFPFMRDAALLGLMIALPAGLLSCFLVLRGWSLMGDAVSHAILPGVVLAYVAGLPLIVGAFAAGFGSALAAGWLQGNSRVKRDTVLGVVMSGMFGLGVVLYTAIPSDLHLDHILFGNMLGIGPGDLWLAGAISLLCPSSAHPIRSSWRVASASESAVRNPGMDSSLSSVPPVCPSPRPLIIGTATPSDATSGASTSETLSPTPPVECLSTLPTPR